MIGETISHYRVLSPDPITLKPGETMRVGEYTLRFEQLVRPKPMPAEKQDEINAEMAVFLMPPEKITAQTQPLTILRPHIDLFKTQGMPTQATRDENTQMARRPAIMSNLANDLYLALIEADDKAGTASIKAYLNPLVMWIWISTVLFIAGTTIAIWPDRRIALARETREQSAAATPAPKRSAPKAARGKEKSR